MVTLNRSAIVVKPKQPFLDWLHMADPTSGSLTMRELVLEPTIYLIPECDTDAEVDAALRVMCEEIFVEQLAGWFTDETTWPKDRGFGLRATPARRKCPPSWPAIHSAN
jgi:hypothetical protein